MRRRYDTPGEPRLPAARLKAVDEIVYLGLLDDDEFELAIAALHLAALDHPDASIADYVDVLEVIDEDVAVKGTSARTSFERAAVLAGVIAGVQGFTGDRDTYDDPANTDMMQVIDRRRGLPVSLSILYVAAARNAGWTTHALNTPGHVLVSVGTGSASVVIDPFNGGAAVDARQLSSLLTGMLGRDVVPSPEHLAPMTNRAVLVRLLTKGATRAEHSGSLGRTRTLYERITTIAPAYPHGWWERARVELTGGDVSAARASLSAMLETTRDPDLRAQASAALDALAGGVG